MVTQEQANHYRGNIIDLATMIEVNIDKFFIDFFVADDEDKVRKFFFMDLFVNILTFGQKIDRFNKVVAGYTKFDEERCKYFKTNLQEFRKLRNNLAHRNGGVNDAGNLFLFAYDKEDIELDDQQIEESIKRWTIFAYEFETFVSNLMHWIFDEND
ncbi:hypothetical protein [Ekhidna sp.]